MTRRLTEPGRVPQEERLDRAVLYVGAHVNGGAETGQAHGALELRLGQVRGGCLDAVHGGEGVANSSV
jgi:hypothetical protein